MENLFERLKPEHKQKLNEMYDQYPSIKQFVVDGLENSNFISHLRFDVVNYLTDVLDSPKIDFSDVYNMFEH
jgi:hypothetical protein